VFDFTLGDGIHMWDILLKDFFTLLYVYLPATVVIVSALTSPSVVQRYSHPLLLQYLRIFVPTRQGKMLLFVAIQLLIWTTVLFYSIGTGFDIFLCNPQKKIWNPLMTIGHCLDTTIIYQASGFFNIISNS
jgi:hypothetical protein